MPRVQFLGTGNAFSPNGRLHALVLIDGNILFDAPPSVLPQLRRVGTSPGQIEHLLFTHWHADHMFGFPFLILERHYISKQDSPLAVHLRAGGRELLSQLSEVGFPGSLGEVLENDIVWNEAESGTIGDSGWSFERFSVVHTPETDPHGYFLSHESGFTLLHCGDSGPCEGIESRADRADVILVEMGVPDFVDSPNHHNPRQVQALAERHPEATVLVTHNYADGKGRSGGFTMPEMTGNVVQLEDGDELSIDENGGFLLVKN